MSGLELMRLVEHWGGAGAGLQGPTGPIGSSHLSHQDGGGVFNLSPDLFYLLDVQG